MICRHMQERCAKCANARRQRKHRLLQAAARRRAAQAGTTYGEFSPVLLAQEGLLLDATELLLQLMQDTGVTRAELARRLGVTRPRVTKLVQG